MSGVSKPPSAAPDQPASDWHSLDWVAIWRTVRRLQARIVKATREGRWNKVKSLVYLLTHSFAGRAVAILRVISNRGARSAGVDGVLWNTPKAKTDAFNTLRRHGYKPQPLRRVHIPKSNSTKKRPLGIPTLVDRAMQGLYLLGLDPISETLADGHSYGFRLERCCADAIGQCFLVLGRSRSARWILEGDIKSCFDQISHSWLLEQIPMDKQLLEGWLKAGYLEKGVLFATKEGSPQGGIISPVLANRTLDGLQQLLTNCFMRTEQQQQRNKVHLVRYADDFIITGTSPVLLEYEVKPLVAHFLKERGLELSHEKTRITHIEDGFDFLGQTIRRYRNGKLLIKPSKRSVRTFLTKIQATIRGSGSWTAGRLIERLNQQIRGWCMYHRHVVSKRIFSYVDHRIFRMLYRWCLKRHRNKRWRWIRKKYFASQEHRRWIFTSVLRNRKGKESPISLMLASRVKIRRYPKIRSEANPYDPSWELYLEERLYWQLEGTLTGKGVIEDLWKSQEGRCGMCGELLRAKEKPWHLHHRLWRSQGGQFHRENLELLHGNCHRQIHSRKES